VVALKNLTLESAMSADEIAAFSSDADKTEPGSTFAKIYV
jgi:hypothetical protein